MPFIIQGQDVAAVPETQSPWYETDIAILVAGIAGTGVLTGCAVTAQGSPDMTVAVASGTIQPSAGAAAVPVTGANKTITTADGDDPRIDLVSASAAGVLTVTDGTPAPIVPGVSGPKPPALPSGHIALAMVDVPASDTAISSGQITDKRCTVFAAVGGGDGDANLWIIAWDSGVSSSTGTWAYQMGEPSVPYASANYNSSHTLNDQLTWTRFLQAGTYSCMIRGVKNTDHAILTLKIDGSIVGTWDQNGSHAYGTTTITGIAVASSGSHTIQIIAASTTSSDYYLVWTDIQFWRTA